MPLSSERPSVVFPDAASTTDLSIVEMNGATDSAERNLCAGARGVLRGRVARRREDGEVVGRLDRVEEELGSQHGCYGLRDGVRASLLVSRAASSPDTWEISGAH